MILLHGGLTIEVLLIVLFFYLIVSIGCFVILLALLRQNKRFAGFLERCKSHSLTRYWLVIGLMYFAATAIAVSILWYSTPD